MTLLYPNLNTFFNTCLDLLRMVLSACYISVLFCRLSTALKVGQGSIVCVMKEKSVPLSLLQPLLHKKDVLTAFIALFLALWNLNKAVDKQEETKLPYLKHQSFDMRPENFLPNFYCSDTNSLKSQLTFRYYINFKTRTAFSYPQNHGSFFFFFRSDRISLASEPW